MREKNYFSRSKKLLKNSVGIMGAVFGLCICVGFSMPETASAKKVSSTLKNGVFTVTGKGKMPESAMPKAAQKKKIKKVVIKKGVTELPEDAFKECDRVTDISIAASVKKIGAKAFFNTGVKKITIPKKAVNLGYGLLQNCKNLQEITIPGDFNATEPEKAANKKDTIGTLILGKGNLNIVKKVKFSTNFDGNCHSLLGDCENFEVLGTDPYYKSIDGCIYSKDGKTLKVVPYGKSEIDIAEGCEVVDTRSYTYKADGDVDGKFVVSIYSGCGQIKKFVFPSTLKSLKEQDFYSIPGVDSKKCTDIEVEFKTDKLDLNTIKTLWDSYYIWRKSLAKELVRMNYATIKDDMVIILEDGGLYGYIGEKENADITIPDEVKYIRRNAFNSLSDATMCKFSIRSVVLNDNVDTLQKYAFAGNKEIKVYTKRVVEIDGFTFKDCGKYQIIKWSNN